MITHFIKSSLVLPIHSKHEGTFCYVLLLYVESLHFKYSRKQKQNH